jgi:hypothetical protein
MKSTDKIGLRIDELRCNIRIIKEKMLAEQNKSVGQRNTTLMKFLDREHNAWEQALQEMEWVLTD